MMAAATQPLRRSTIESASTSRTRPGPGARLALLGFFLFAAIAAATPAHAASLRKTHVGAADDVRPVQIEILLRLEPDSHWGCGLTTGNPTDVPQVGRFVSPDPIGMAGDGLANVFRYVGNAPAGYVDPLGLRPPGIFDAEAYRSVPDFGHALMRSAAWALDDVLGAAVTVLGEIGDAANKAAGHLSGNPNDPKALEVVGATCMSMGVPQGRVAGSLAEGLEYLRALRTAGPTAAAIEASRAWRLVDVLKRGGILEELRGSNLPRNFPVIDRFVNGGATSIKSIDLTLDAYRTGSRLESTLDSWVRLLGGWRGQPRAWGGVAINESQCTGRVLEIVVPQGALTAEQADVFNRVAQKARDVYGVIVRVVELGQR